MGPNLHEKIRRRHHLEVDMAGDDPAGEVTPGTLLGMRFRTSLINGHLGTNSLKCYDEDLPLRKSRRRVAVA